MFGFEKVDLRFTDEALRAIAKEALVRKTGARGLRGVIESSMMDIMFEIPSKANVKECIIDEEVITLRKAPTLVYRTDEEMEQMEESQSQSKAIIGGKKDDSAESA